MLTDPSLRRAALAHDHLVHFYTDDAGLVGEWADFIGAALASGSSVVLIATQDHIDGILAQLRGCGVDVPLAIAEGRFLVNNAADALAQFFKAGSLNARRFYLLVEGLLSQAAAASRESEGRVVAFGEMVALLWAQGEEEAAIELERLWNRVGRSRSFTSRCAYPIEHFRGGDHGSEFLQICAEHSLVISDEAIQPFKAAPREL